MRPDVIESEGYLGKEVGDRSIKIWEKVQKECKNEMEQEKNGREKQQSRLPQGFLRSIMKTNSIFTGFQFLLPFGMIFLILRNSKGKIRI